MKRRLLPAALLGLAALALAGCTTSVNTTSPKAPRTDPDIVADRRLVTDLTLSRKIELVAVNEARVSGDLLKVQATLRNRTRSPQNIAYKIDFIAADGMELAAPGSGWKRIQLEGGEERAISAVATSPRATDFRVKLRE